MSWRSWMEKNVSYSFEESAVFSNKYDITRHPNFKYDS